MFNENSPFNNQSTESELPAIMLPREKREILVKRRDTKELIDSYKKANLSVHDEGINFTFNSPELSFQADIKWSAIRIIKELFQ
jgi:hypothetical protein